jgi:hypothetical protein
VRADLEEKILKRFPLIYRHGEHGRDPLIACGDGWHDLLVAFSAKLMALPNDATPLYICKVLSAMHHDGQGQEGSDIGNVFNGEYLGPGLAFWARWNRVMFSEFGLRRQKSGFMLPRTGAYTDLVKWTRSESQKVCETCGKRGAPRIDSYLEGRNRVCRTERFYVTCDEHAIVEGRKLEFLPPKILRLPDPEPEQPPKPPRDGSWGYHDRERDQDYQDGDPARDFETGIDADEQIASCNLRTIVWLLARRREMDLRHLTVEQLSSVPEPSWWAVIREYCNDPKWGRERKLKDSMYRGPRPPSASGIEIMEEMRSILVSYGLKFPGAS